MTYSHRLTGRRDDAWKESGHIEFLFIKIKGHLFSRYLHLDKAVCLTDSNLKTLFLILYIEVFGMDYSF